MSFNSTQLFVISCKIFIERAAKVFQIFYLKHTRGVMWILQLPIDVLRVINTGNENVW